MLNSLIINLFHSNKLLSNTKLSDTIAELVYKENILYDCAYDCLKHGCFFRCVLAVKPTVLSNGKCSS